MSVTFEIVDFPEKNAIAHALLTEDHHRGREVLFQAYRLDDETKRTVSLGVTINRIKRIREEAGCAAVWQFTGRFTSGDASLFAAGGKLYAGGEFSIQDEKVTWAVSTRHLVIVNEEEFQLFQR